MFMDIKIQCSTVFTLHVNQMFWYSLPDLQSSLDFQTLAQTKASTIPAGPEESHSYPKLSAPQKEKKTICAYRKKIG